ncbi:MAG: PaaI family thioesterase, partial [Marinomonas sp.]
MTLTPLDPELNEAPYALQRHLGFQLTHWDSDFARIELPIEHFLMNRAGIPHGGIYATLLDTVMGYAGCYIGDPAHKKLAVTLSMTTNFLSRPKGH